MWQPPADALAALTRRWSVTVGTPFAGPEVSAAWVAPVRRADGTRAVLKLGMPHMEARDEIAGLRFWNGDPTVRLLAWDDELNAMLLERCEPGTHLRTLPEGEQDVVIAGLLRRLWRSAEAFRPLAELTAHWAAETLAAEERWPCEERLWARPLETIERFASLLDRRAERVRLWIFARVAAEPRDDWRGPELELARALAPR